jgi:16S rRNA (cytosine967-C5)-methyltransferase
LRVNTLKMGLEELKFKLNEEGVQTVRVPTVETALNLKERKNVFTTEAYKNGCFEMQDGGSQMIAPFLKVEPGQRVIDACAGAGGKTLHLAALMQNKGRIIAMDIHDYKLEKLKIRARRAGISVIENRVIDTTKVVKRLEGSADRLLLDVPCSGLGVVRRHPDTKWKLTGEEINKLHVVQTDILERYTKMVKVGGYVVYATCSILPSENEKQVAAFIAKHKEQFSLEEELQVSPIETNFDGFYAARLKRLS